MAGAREKYWAWSASRVERARFLFVVDDADLVLIAPFPKRPHGPNPVEMALVDAVAGRLVRNLAPCWVDAADGHTTPATIGAGQIQRKLFDFESFVLQTG